MTPLQASDTKKQYPNANVTPKRLSGLFTLPQNSFHAWYSASAVLTKRAPRSLNGCNGQGLHLGSAAERRKTSSGSITQDRRVSTALSVSYQHNSSTGIQVLVCSCLTGTYSVDLGVKIQKRS